MLSSGTMVGYYHAVDGYVGRLLGFYFPCFCCVFINGEVKERERKRDYFVFYGIVLLMPLANAADRLWLRQDGVREEFPQNPDPQGDAPGAERSEGGRAGGPGKAPEDYDDR